MDDERTAAEAREQARSSTPVLMGLLNKAAYGRDDGTNADSQNGTATVWDNYNLCYRVQPSYRNFPLLMNAFSNYLHRREERKNSVSGLQVICQCLENELEYNKQCVSWYKRDLEMAKSTWRREPTSVINRLELKEALFKDLQNEEHERKVFDELATMEKRLLDMIEKEVVQQDEEAEEIEKEVIQDDEEAEEILGPVRKQLKF